MIDEISSKLTGFIKKSNGSMDKEREEIINYGLNILIYEVFMTAVVILLSILFGVFLNAVVLLLVNGILRLFAGGAHARTRFACASSYLVIASGIIVLAKITWAESFYPCLALLALELFLLYRYAPGDTEEKPMASKRIKRRMKILSIVADIAIFAAAIAIWHYSREMYNMIILSTIITMFLISPAGYRTFGCHRSHYDTQTMYSSATTAEIN